GGIDAVPEDLEQPLVRHPARVVADFDRLVVAGGPAAHLLVGRMDLLAPSVPGDHRLHPRDSLELSLHAPEAPAREGGDPGPWRARPLRRAPAQGGEPEDARQRRSAADLRTGIHETLPARTAAWMRPPIGAASRGTCRPAPT